MTENSENRFSAQTTPPPLPPPLPPEAFEQQQEQMRAEPQAPSGAMRTLKKMFMPVIIGLLLVVKYIAKVKFLVIPVLKYGFAILKTGGSMILSIGAYAIFWGWWFALGFVLLIFIHECGHLLAAKRIGLKVGAPVFIPFMGAIIALKEAPRNAWIEAQVGMGGPLIGALGALACEGLYWVTGNELFRALAYTGFFLNLFNLIPVGFLDGGRIVTAISPWLWVVGFVATVALMVVSFNFILMLIVILSAPRVFSLFRKKSEEEARYFEVTPYQRWITTFLYFGLIISLVIGMGISMIQVPQKTI